MWWLLRTMCLLHIIGNIFSLFKPKPRNPEANMNVGEMISYWGYIYEEYDVVTEDGYIITIYRIPRGKNESRNLVPKPVVYLHHGWTLSASVWILNPPSGSLGFLLADAGFDVWMGNSRGNTYARKHVYLDPDSREFWAFSYDQQIKYDIPATIDFIMNKTAQKHIYYVGYSEGTLLAFGAFATNPQLAQKIKINFALGPAATVKHMSGLLRLIGYVKKTLSKSRFDVYAGQAPVGTSVQSMLHYSQGIRTGVFQAYDWGSSSLNMLHYSQPTPPLYDVKKMKVPTAMWSGGRDLLADPTDVKHLEANISNLIYHKKIADYSHLDLVIGLNAPDEVFNEIVTFITEDQSG